MNFKDFTVDVVTVTVSYLFVVNEVVVVVSVLTMFSVNDISLVNSGK